MSASLDMSLDDIIRKNKRSGGNSGNNTRGGRGSGRGGGRSAGPGPSRRFETRPPIRPTPYSLPQQDAVQPFRVPDAVWPPGLFMDGGSDIKLYVSNLDYGVSNDDLQLLFSDVGELKHYSLHYDRNGRSKGTAEVVFIRQEHALAAVRRFNNVQLDGKPMKIELVGVNMVAPSPLVPPAANGILGNPQSNFRSAQEGRGSQGWIHGGGSRGSFGRGYGRGLVRGRGQGHGGGKTEEKISAKDLDADLDKYHLEAMQIN